MPDPSSSSSSSLPPRRVPRHDGPTVLSVFFAVLVVTVTLLWALQKRVFRVRQQWLKFKRLSRAGPFYRFAVWLHRRFWETVSKMLWRVYGAGKMDAPPGKDTAPRLALTAKTVDTLALSWTAKPSSYYSRDSFQLQVRGCVGPVLANTSTDWHDCFGEKKKKKEKEGGEAGKEAEAEEKKGGAEEENKEGENKETAAAGAAKESSGDGDVNGRPAASALTKERSFVVGGLEAGQCLEFRCRTCNSRGEGPWSDPPLRAYTRQRPVNGGGRGPSYIWRQSGRMVLLVMPLPKAGDGSAIRAKHISFKCTPTSLRVTVPLSLLGDAPSSSSSSSSSSDTFVLAAGDFYLPVIAELAEWDIQEGLKDIGGRCVVVTVEKENASFKAKDHWPHALKGHPTIDTESLENIIEESILVLD